MTLKELIEKVLNWLKANQIKDNLTFIILIPTILGGIWQIWELSNVSVGFIRFFSISQLVSDGLLILFLLFFSWIFFKIGSSLGRFRKRSAKERIVYFQKSARQYVFLMLAVPALSASVTWILFGTKYFQFDVFIVAAIIGLSVSLLRTIFIDCGLNLSLHRLLKKGYKKIIDTTTKIIVGILLVLSLNQLPNLLSEFHKNYSLPLNFENAKNLKEYISRKKGINIKSIEIKYFNDKFIFIETKSNGNKFLVLELSKLYEDDILFNAQ